MAFRASVTCFAVLAGFGLIGAHVFKILGITMPAFQIAASIVLLIVALDMLRAQRSRVQETNEETSAGLEKADIAITPLAMPMLAGPGAISTAILLQNRGTGLSGTFGGDSAVYRSRRGVERRLWQFTVVLLVLFVLFALVAFVTA